MNTIQKIYALISVIFTLTILGLFIPYIYYDGRLFHAGFFEFRKNEIDISRLALYLSFPIVLFLFAFRYFKGHNDINNPATKKSIRIEFYSFILFCLISGIYPSYMLISNGILFLEKSYYEKETDKLIKERNGIYPLKLTRRNRFYSIYSAYVQNNGINILPGEVDIPNSFKFWEYIDKKLSDKISGETWVNTLYDNLKSTHIDKNGIKMTSFDGHPIIPRMDLTDFWEFNINSKEDLKTFFVQSKLSLQDKEKLNRCIQLNQSILNNRSHINSDLILFEEDDIKSSYLYSLITALLIIYVARPTVNFMTSTFKIIK